MDLFPNLYDASQTLEFRKVMLLYITYMTVGLYTFRCWPVAVNRIICVLIVYRINTICKL